MRRAAALLGAALAVASSAACSSSGRSSGGSTSPSSPAATSATAGTSVSPATLAATVRRGLSGVRSAHVVLAIGIAGRKATITGDESVPAGAAPDVRVSSTDIDGSGPVSLVIVGSTVYAKLPRSINTTGKPYVVLSGTSTDAKVRRAAATIATVRGAVSLDNASSLLEAARTARRVGASTVDGTATTRYRLVVPTSALPASFPGRDLLAQVGVKDLDVDLDLDAKDRPVRIASSLKVGGQPSSLVITVNRYDRPVTITAPPATQVGTI